MVVYPSTRPFEHIRCQKNELRVLGSRVILRERVQAMAHRRVPRTNNDFDRISTIIHDFEQTGNHQALYFSPRRRTKRLY